VVALPLLLALGAPPVAAPFPVAPGQFWEYRETYTEQLGDVAASSEDTTRVYVIGSLSAPFLKQEGGAEPTPGPIEWGEGWIRLTTWTGEEALPLPLAKGGVGPGVEPGRPGWLVEDEEEVKVPAGAYRAWRCVLRTRETLSVLWIAPGVGVVREWHGTPNGKPELERELLRFGAGPPPAGPRPRRRP
jgi:hypothetical protein